LEKFLNFISFFIFPFFVFFFFFFFFYCWLLRSYCIVLCLILSFTSCYFRLLRKHFSYCSEDFEYKGGPFSARDDFWLDLVKFMPCRVYLMYSLMSQKASPFPIFVSFLSLGDYFQYLIFPFTLPWSCLLNCCNVVF